MAGSISAATSKAKNQAQAQSIPAYLQIKRHIIAHIQSGTWTEGEAIPGEEALARLFKVSRMTVNRVMRELSDEQIVVRVQGSGTFVAQQKYQATLVEIRDIAQEIAARGHTHRGQLHRIERVKAGEMLGRQFALAPSKSLFHSIMVHFENNEPIQVEDRYVNPAIAPDYLKMDFTSQTPNAYLMRVAPVQKVHFVVEACQPSAEVAQLLRMGAEETCLVLRRQTHSQGQVASIAARWHPASRYRFTGSF